MNFWAKFIQTSIIDGSLSVEKCAVSLIEICPDLGHPNEKPVRNVTFFV